MQSEMAIAVFGKSLHDLELPDIKRYFSAPKKESNTIEFKAYVDDQNPNTTKQKRDNEKISAITRTLCAFLNSDGGILIWGAPKGKPIGDDVEESYQGALLSVEYSIEKDQFINKVSSQISPLPRDIYFHRIADSDKFIYVIQASKSNFSPHQYKGTYYMRLDGQTVPAPHYIVEALMKKIQFPNLVAHVAFGKLKVFRRTIGIPLVVTIHNLSRYIHEKNLDYRIIVGNSDLIRADARQIQKILFGESSIEQACKPIFHYNAPHFDEYLLLNSRDISTDVATEITILFSFGGELSPVKVNRYKLVLTRSMRDNYQYQIAESVENQFSYEFSDSMNLTEEERMAKGMDNILQSLERRLPEMAVYTILNNGM